MKKREEEYIDALLIDVSARYPNSNYKYELIEDTHFIKVYGIKSAEKDHFASFKIDALIGFINSGFDSMLLLTEEEIIVEMKDPSKFSLTGGILEGEKESSIEVGNSDFLIMAA